MGKFILKRLARLVATIFAVTFLTFLMTYLLPGDPAVAILGTEGIQNEELLEQVREDLNLNDPFYERYWAWLSDAVTGDLGRSYIQGQEVADTISDRVPVTGQLAVMAIILALVGAIPIGIIGAYRQGRWEDKATSAGVQVALSLPNFVTGIFFIWLFAVQLNWLPASNWNRISDKGIWENFKTAIMPAAALAATQMAIFSRLIRADMIATLRENYILAARAKGLSDRFILARHALRPSSLSVATLVGINFGALLGGTVVIETLFAIPGIGFRLFNAINQRDVLVIQGIVVFLATVYVVINFLVDMFYTVIDPRIRRS